MRQKLWLLSWNLGTNWNVKRTNRRTHIHLNIHTTWLKWFYIRPLPSIAVDRQKLHIIWKLYVLASDATLCGNIGLSYLVLNVNNGGHIWPWPLTLMTKIDGSAQDICCSGLYLYFYLQGGQPKPPSAEDVYVRLNAQPDYDHWNKLWNKLPASLRQPCLNQSSSPSSSSLSPLSSSITTSLFHSKLKTYLFQKSFPP